MKDIIVAIDGHSGCGKSSTAKEVANALGYTYLDSGAMYRAVTLFFIEEAVDIQNKNEVLLALDKISVRFATDKETLQNETYLNGNNVENEIREMSVSERVSDVSALPQVRLKMVEQQRQMGKSKRVVMDGRDIGTHVFPNAELKIFMMADLQTRAKRRHRELKLKGKEARLEDIINNLSERDRIDTGRKKNPLRKAPDAIDVDTTNLDFAEQVQRIVSLAKDKMEL